MNCSGAGMADDRRRGGKRAAAGYVQCEGGEPPGTPRRSAHRKTGVRCGPAHVGCQRSRRRPGRRASQARPAPRLRIATGVKCHPRAVAGLRAQVTRWGPVRWAAGQQQRKQAEEQRGRGAGREQERSSAETERGRRREQSKIGGQQRGEAGCGVPADRQWPARGCRRRRRRTLRPGRCTQKQPPQPQSVSALVVSL